MKRYGYGGGHSAAELAARSAAPSTYEDLMKRYGYGGGHSAAELAARSAAPSTYEDLMKRYGYGGGHSAAELAARSAAPFPHQDSSKGLGTHATPATARTENRAAVDASARDSGIVSGRPVRSVEMLGQLVRQARKRAKLSQQQLADAAEVGRRFVSELENGKPTLEIGRVLKVCEAAGVDILIAARQA